tara:strand:- start:1340 stop:1549 length:210 start_codon:yes stop_codon:yes gene_type:complete
MFKTVLKSLAAAKKSKVTTGVAVIVALILVANTMGWVADDQVERLSLIAVAVLGFFANDAKADDEEPTN